MAQNLFEKYGIKEVADVTLYRIERKDETYESQRKIPISSILKGALTKETVYPLDEDGKGSSEGYDAYVFKDADVLKHFNYDCDDSIEVKGTAVFIDEDPLIENPVYKKGQAISDDDLALIKEFLSADDDAHNAVADNSVPNLFEADNVVITSLVEQGTNRNVRGEYANWLLNGYTVQTADKSGLTEFDVKIEKVAFDGTTISAVDFDTVNLVEYRSYLKAPTKVEKDIKEGLVSFLNGVTEGSNDLTGAYISVYAPIDATGDELWYRFKMQQDAIYRALGVVTRFTQPVREGNGTAIETLYTGKIGFVANFRKTGEDITENESGNFSVYFGGVAVSDKVSEVIAKFKSLANGESVTITEADIDTLFGAPGADVTLPKGYKSYATWKAVYNFDASGLDQTVTVTEVNVEDNVYNKYVVKFSATFVQNEEILTGRYDLGAGTDEGHYAMDADRSHGTHEYTYSQQICMLFAKNQNLITKAGTRYQFDNADELFGAFEFDDNFATAPSGRERAVVVGLAGRITENLYDFDEINEAIRELTETIEAKAYDIVYTDYAELLVEDEMGFYLPQQLGYFLSKKTNAVTFFGENGYDAWAKRNRGIDYGIAKAIKTWGDNKHYSINDAIDALKYEQKIVDVGTDVTERGFSRVFGGYKVTGKESVTDTLPLDDMGRGLGYEDYTVNGVAINDMTTGEKLSSRYSLESVLQALSVADLDGATGQIRITSTAEMDSNRAIYVDPDSGVLANRANIYLLKNVNGKALSNDKNGIFEFRDKKGNRLYYQDKVFAGTAYLALVIIGNMGLIFVAGRHCTRNIDKVAWMVNDNGYLTDKQAERIVKNGLIHTVDITVCDETFDATCTAGSIKVRKTKKNVLRYVPVLFLDTLKVSTLEQAAESTDATGGRGNAKLITWDYGKEITLSIEDALYTPASMAAIWGGEHGDLKNGVKDTHMIDRMEKITAKRSFIVPAGNREGTPTEGNVTAQAVYFDPKTMEPFQDGTPIAEGEVVYKFTRSVAYDNNSIGNTIEVSADGFPGTYKVVGETMVKDKATGEDQRFQFIIPEAKMSANDTSITLEADGDPVVFSFTMNVLRPENGIMMKFVQFDVVDNVEENDGSTMVKDTENLNLLDDAEMYKVSGGEDEELVIGATEY